jgi:hypothetical protein
MIIPQIGGGSLASFKVSTNIASENPKKEERDTLKGFN